MSTLKRTAEKKVRLAVSKDVPVPLLAPLASFESGLEPFVFVASMIGHNVNHHPDPMLLELGYHLVKVLEGANVRIDIAIVNHIVCAVSLPAPFLNPKPDMSPYRLYRCY
jgi:hypothetical protein